MSHTTDFMIQAHNRRDRATILHADSTSASLTHLANLPRPEARGPAHHPLPHIDFINLMGDRLRHFNYDIEDTRYYLNRGHDQLFGVARVVTDKPDYQPVIGFRNSHDMSCSAGVALGMRVFVCDNMCFSGQIVIQRKHTLHIMDDLPALIDDAILRLKGINRTQDERVIAYKQCEIESDTAAHLLLQLHANDALPANKIRAVWDHYLTDPLRYDYDASPTLWRLYNAITWSWKRSTAQLMGPIHKRSAHVHTVLDGEAHARGMFSVINGELA